MKSSLICLLLVAIAIAACAQTPQANVPPNIEPKAAPTPTVTPAPSKPNAYPMSAEQQAKLRELATAENQAIGELMNAEGALKAAPIKRASLQVLLKENAKLDAKQTVRFVGTLMAASQWQEAAQVKANATKAILDWINANRPPDCPECQLSRDGTQWVR